eukprot:5038132-Pyramimonas_sp.AAC.1
MYGSTLTHSERSLRRGHITYTIHRSRFTVRHTLRQDHDIQGAPTHRHRAPSCPSPHLGRRPAAAHAGQPPSSTRGRGQRPHRHL